MIRTTPVLLNLLFKANVLIDQTGRPLLGDFGLLTIVSDPANPSSSYVQGGTVRWMSPEPLDPERYELKNSRPTKSSDCYALGMVTYETISGNPPFYEYPDLIAPPKALEGKRPLRGVMFMDSLWNMLERCWASQPYIRPSTEDVLRCLIFSNLSPSLSPGVDEGMEADVNDSDSASSSSDFYQPDANWFGREASELDLQINSNDRGTRQVTAFQSRTPPTLCLTHCVEPARNV